MPFRLILTLLPIWIRIYRILCRIRFPSLPWIKIGYGAKLGVLTSRSKLQRRVSFICRTMVKKGRLTQLQVDLCQNPLTKEPKLARARQIPEWDVYDQEVAAFAKRIGGSAGKGLAGSVDALAGAAVQVDENEDSADSRRLDDEL